MMDKWLKKATPGNKGLTRPPASEHVSVHKNEVRSIVRGNFQNRFRVSAYKQVGRPTHDSQKREESLEKVTNAFMEQYTLLRVCLFYCHSKSVWSNLIDHPT